VGRGGPRPGGGVIRPCYLANGADWPLSWGYRGGAPAGEFAPGRLGIDFRRSGIDFQRSGIDSYPSRIDFWWPGIDFWSMRIDDGPLRIDDGPLRIDDGRLRIDGGRLRIDDGRLRVDDGRPRGDDESLRVDDKRPRMGAARPRIDARALVTAAGPPRGLVRMRRVPTAGGRASIRSSAACRLPAGRPLPRDAEDPFAQPLDRFTGVKEEPAPEAVAVVVPEDPKAPQVRRSRAGPRLHLEREEVLETMTQPTTEP